MTGPGTVDRSGTPAAPAPAASRSRRRRLAGLAAGLAILGFLGYSVVTGWSRVAAYDWQLQPALLCAALAALLAFYAVSGAGYGVIVAGLHTPAPPWPVTLSIWGRSLLGRYVPGNVLMVASRVVLAHERGVPRRASLAATVYEQALGLGIAAVGAVTFVALHGSLGQGSAIWLLALVPAGLALLHPRAFGPLTGWALRRARREPLAQLLSARQVAALAGLYAVAALLLVLGVWLLVRAAAGPEAGGVAFVGLGFLLAFVVSILAFVFPSGLGVREGAFALVLAQNLSGAVAVTLSVGVRLVLTLVELVFVAAVVMAGRRHA